MTNEQEKKAKLKLNEQDAKQQQPTFVFKVRTESHLAHTTQIESDANLKRAPL